MMAPMKALMIVLKRTRRAVESAIAAAEKILKTRITGTTADKLIEDGIRDLDGKLN